MQKFNFLLGVILLWIHVATGEDFEGIPQAVGEEIDAAFYRISRSKEPTAALDERNNDFDDDDEEEFDSIDSRGIQQDDIISDDKLDIEARRNKVKSRSKPPSPPQKPNPEDKLKGKADDMLPKSRGKQVKRDIHKERGLKAEKKRRKNKKKKRGTKRDNWPEVIGVNMDDFRDHPHGSLRPGQATNTHSCNKVRGIPAFLRYTSFYNKGINSFYTKYTEAYGIPVIGSNDVTDEGLKRACYVLRILLASRYDIRIAYFKMWGRFALIGDNEQQTRLYEYRTWDSNYWDKRARGLGPTYTIPLSSAGDDNARCKPGDRYYNQDISVHEFSHGVHHLGATLVIEGFEKRLKAIYDRMVKKRGKWAGSYAATNVNEYFAVASQFYFNAFRGPGDYLKNFGVFDRTSMRAYDPFISELLDEVHPCAADDESMLIHRCDWKIKDCRFDRFTLKYDTTFRAKAVCKHMGEATKSTPEECAVAACYFEGNVFNWAGSKCIVEKCDDISTVKGLGIDLNQGAYNIYVSDVSTIPQMTLKAEQAQNVKMHCAIGPSGTDYCSSVVDRKTCGDPATTTKSQCKGMGCCWSNDECFYSNTECTDVSLYCHEWAAKGECVRNPGFMYRKCQVACDICPRTSELDNDELMSMCQDKNEHCQEWAADGECNSNPNWMNKNCKLSCNICNNAYDPLAK